MIPKSAPWGDSLIFKVEISRNAQRNLSKVPLHIAKKLKAWTLLVKTMGLEEARKVKSFHDEPLKGERKGQRSIRLNQAYRAIYIIATDGSIEFVSVEEVNKHDY